jgi:hypothetical protein
MVYLLEPLVLLDLSLDDLGGCGETVLNFRDRSVVPDPAGLELAYLGVEKVQISLGSLDGRLQNGELCVCMCQVLSIG